MGRSAERAGENSAENAPTRSSGINGPQVPQGTVQAIKATNEIITRQRARLAVIMRLRRGIRSASQPVIGPSRKNGTKNTKVIRASSGVTSMSEPAAFCVLRMAILER